MLKIGDYSMRTIEEKDLEQILVWRNSERIRSVMFTDYIISMQEHLAWFERIKQLKPPVHFVFEYKDRPIGYISYTDIDQRNSTCLSGTYLGEQTGIPDLAGIVLNYFTEEYAFEKLRMRKTWAYCLAYNKKIIKLGKIFGRQQEGVLKQHVLKNGKYEDVVIMALFYNDWKIKREALHQYLFPE